MQKKERKMRRIEKNTQQQEIEISVMNEMRERERKLKKMCQRIKLNRKQVQNYKNIVDIIYLK